MSKRCGLVVRDPDQHVRPDVVWELLPPTATPSSLLSPSNQHTFLYLQHDSHSDLLCQSSSCVIYSISELSLRALRQAWRPHRKSRFPPLGRTPTSAASDANMSLPQPLSGRIGLMSTIPHSFPSLISCRMFSQQSGYVSILFDSILKRYLLFGSGPTSNRY